MSDQLVRAISKDGFVKAAAVSTRALTERARQIHQTSPVATAALGRLLAALFMWWGTAAVRMMPLSLCQNWQLGKLNKEIQL